MILPDFTQEQIESFDSNSIRMIRNDSLAQIVLIGGIGYMTVYQGMNIDFGNNTKARITNPGNYMVHVQNGEFIASAPFL